MAALVFASAVPAADSHYQLARQYITEARQTVNAVRLVVLAWKITEELEETIRLDPGHLEARLDLVRFYVVAPRIVGGNYDKARAQASEIARRDAHLGHFAAGYIAYRQKQYTTARRELRDAMKTGSKPSTRILALTWLGWLSQETQQYDEAFWAFEKVLAIDPLQLSASYEIGRTAVFCRCRVERGEEALLRFLAGNAVDKRDAEELLAKLSGVRRP
jgi:tetratricopeptide (TPR) repeat protein